MAFMDIPISWVSFRAPIVGSLFRLSALRSIEKAASEGERDAVRMLTHALAESEFSDVKTSAAATLSSLSNPAAVEIFCEYALESGDPLLLDIASEQGYLPLREEKKALFLFLSGQMDLYRDLDPLEGHPLLVTGLRSATPQVRSRVLDLARKEGMVSVILSLGTCVNDVEWLPGDWKTKIRLLADERRYDEMFRLLFLAPLPTAVDIVHTLAGSGWKPGKPDQTLWKALTSTVPGTWDFPDPPPSKGKILAGHAEMIKSAAISPDGQFVATVGYGGSLCQWSLPEGTLTSTGNAAFGTITCLSFSADSTALVFGTDEGVIWLIRAGDSVPITTLKGHSGPVTSMVFSDDANLLITGGGDGTLCSWKWPGCDECSATHAHNGAVTAIAAWKNIFASSGRDGAIHIWKEGGDNDRTLSNPGNVMHRLFFCGRGEYLAGVDIRGTVRVWNCDDGALFRAIPTAGGRLIAWDNIPSGNIGVLASDDHNACIFSFPGGSEFERLEIPGKGISCLALTPSGTHLLAGCRDGYLHTWSLPEGRKTSMIKGHPDWIRLLAVNREGTGVVSAGREGMLRFRKLPGADLLCTIQGPGTGIHSLSSTPGGELVGCGTDGGILRVWDSKTGEQRYCHNLFTGRIECIALHPSGTMAACGDGYGRISLWEMGSGSLRATLDGNHGGVRALAIDGSGSLLASGGWDGVVRIWSLPEGEPVAELSGHSSQITSLTFLPGTPFLASGSQDRTAIIWNTRSHEVHMRLTGHSHVVSCLGTSGDGGILATGSWDRTVRLWSIPSGEMLGVLKGHRDRVHAVSVHPDGTLIATATESGNVALFTLPGCIPVRSGKTCADARNGICLIASENLLASAGRDGTLMLSGIPWTRPLSRTNPGDLAYVQSCITPELPASSARQWKFLGHLLAGKFRHSIEYGGAGQPAGPYDMEIVESPGHLSHIATVEHADAV